MRADDGGIRAEYRLQLRRKGAQAVGFDAQKNDIHRAYFFKRSGDARLRHKISVTALYLHAVFLHGAKMRTAREQGDVETGLRHARADVGADGAGSCNQKSHC